MSAQPRSASGGAQTLFLHAIGLDHDMWTGVLAPGDRALDLPGHGSQPPLGSVSMAALADDVAARVSEPVALVGLSLGGMVAQHVAIRSPEAVASLVVVASTSATRSAMMAERARRTREAGMEGLLDSTLERWFTPEALATPGHPGVEYVRKRLLDDDAEVVARYWEAMAEHDVTSQLASIRVPTTFIAGSRDAAGGPEAMEPMARAVPNAVLEVVDGPHMLSLERPRELRAAIDRHLARSSS